MRITRIDLEGRPGRYATISRRRASRWIEVTLLTPSQPDGSEHRIAADAGSRELWRQARHLQHALDGRVGSTGDIDGYYRQLQRFTD